MAPKINEVERERIVLDAIAGKNIAQLAKKYKRDRKSIVETLNRSKERIAKAKEDQKQAYRDLIEQKLDLNTLDVVETLADGILILKKLRQRFINRLNAPDDIADCDLPTWMNSGLKYVKEMNMVILSMQKGAGNE
jgi:hypothetical protein